MSMFLLKDLWSFICLVYETRRRKYINLAQYRHHLKVPCFGFLFIKVLLKCFCWCVYLVVVVLPVQGDVDGEGGGVVMRPQIRLLIRAVTHHEVHDGLSLHTHRGLMIGSLFLDCSFR